MAVVTLGSQVTEGPNRRWIVWWVVRRLCHNVIAGRRRTRFLNVLKTGFPAAPATLHGRNKLRPRSPFSDGKNAGNRTYPGWMAWISALCTCAHTHACRKAKPARFWRVFGWFVACFCRFPVRNALRASQAVLITDVMVNVKNISLDKKAFKKNNTMAHKLWWTRAMHIEFKPSSDFNNVKINRAPDGALWRRKLLAAILTGARILTAEAMWNALAIARLWQFPTGNNWLYFGERRQGCLYLKNVL